MPGTRAGAEMGFYDHLEVLRRRIVVSLVAFAVAAGAFFACMDRLMPLILSPARMAGLKLYTHAPYEKFAAYLKASAVLGAAAAIPLALCLGAAFIAPALGPRARRTLALSAVAVPAFALAGAALAWFAILPWALRFFSSFAAGDGIEPLWNLDSFISLAAGLLAATGVVFLVPPCLLALVRVGVLKPSTLAKGRRYAIVAIVIVAGAITPTVDVVTQVVVAAVLYALFEITLLVGRLVSPERIGKKEKPEVIDG